MTMIDTHREPLDYDAACAAAATRQGLDPIAAELAAQGVEYTLEQTGGWCMVLTVTVTTGIYALTADAGEGMAEVGWFPGTTWHDLRDASDVRYFEVATETLDLWAHAVALLQTATRPAPAAPAAPVALDGPAAGTESEEFTACAYRWTGKEHDPYIVVDVDTTGPDETPTPLRIYVNDGMVYEQGIDGAPLPRGEG